MMTEKITRLIPSVEVEWPERMWLKLGDIEKLPQREILRVVAHWGMQIREKRFLPDSNSNWRVVIHDFAFISISSNALPVTYPYKLQGAFLVRLVDLLVYLKSERLAVALGEPGKPKAEMFEVYKGNDGASLWVGELQDTGTPGTLLAKAAVVQLRGT